MCVCVCKDACFWAGEGDSFHLAASPVVEKKLLLEPESGWWHIYQPLSHTQKKSVYMSIFSYFICAWSVFEPFWCRLVLIRFISFIHTIISSSVFFKEGTKLRTCIVLAIDGCRLFPVLCCWLLSKKGVFDSSGGAESIIVNRPVHNFTQRVCKASTLYMQSRGVVLKELVASDYICNLISLVTQW